MTTAVVRAGARIEGLDGLRAVAVTAVVVLHLGAFLEPSWSEVAPGGWLGVDLFMVLSGYLITSILVAQVGTRRWGARFYLRRFRRLVPPLALMLLVVGVGDHFGWLNDAPEADFSMTAVTSLLYVFNWADLHGLIAHDYLAHLWSLAVEEQFYVVWPLVVLLVRRRLFWFALGGVVLVMMWRSVVFEWDWFAAYSRTDTRADTFLIGACIALAPRLRSVLARFASVGLTVWLLGVLIVPAHWWLLYEDSYITVFAVASAAMVAGVVERGWCGRVLEARPVVAIGAVTYGIYLWHYPAFRFVQLKMEWTGPGAVVAGFALTAAGTVASWWLVERRRLRERPLDGAADVELVTAGPGHRSGRGEGREVSSGGSHGEPDHLRGGVEHGGRDLEPVTRRVVEDDPGDDVEHVRRDVGCREPRGQRELPVP